MQNFKNFEFIIINDGSTDTTKTILDKYSNSDNRIRIINKTNTGLSNSLNVGLQVAKGKYIARIDADDLCLPNRLKIQYDFLEKNLDYVLVSSAVIYIDNHDKILGRSFPVLYNKTIKKRLRNINPIAHSSVMIRSSILKKIGGYNEVIRQHFEDYYLWLKLIKEGKFRTLATPLIKYRLTSDSLSSINMTKELLSNIIKLCNKEHILKVDYNNLLKLIEKNKIHQRKIAHYSKLFIKAGLLSRLVCSIKSLPYLVN